MAEMLESHPFRPAPLWFPSTVRADWRNKGSCRPGGM